MTVTAPADAREAADLRKHTCANCRRGNHSSCTLPERCAHFECDKPRTIPSLEDASKPAPDKQHWICPEDGCEDKLFDTPQMLGAHRRIVHPGTAGRPAVRDDRTLPAPKGTTKPVVVIELVDDEPPPPPPPPAPKKKPAELIVETVAAADLSDGAWRRCAIFPTSNAAKRMATRLTNDAASYEWQASKDGRLFVRVAQV